MTSGINSEADSLQEKNLFTHHSAADIGRVETEMIRSTPVNRCGRNKPIDLPGICRMNSQSNFCRRSMYDLIRSKQIVLLAKSDTHVCWHVRL